MVRGDYRNMPRYRFWVAIVGFVFSGTALGWFLSRDHLDYKLGLLPGALIGLAVVFWLNRRGHLDGGRSGLAHTAAEPYEHPILGLYFGLSATITLLLLDESWTYAVLVGLGMGVLLAVGTLALRRRRTRNDGPGRDRPIPTLTGWR